MKKLTRDETEHGQEYYLAAEVDALLAQPAQEPVHSVQSNGRHSPLLTHMINKRTVSAQPAQEPKDIAKLVEGMEVSIDVSTGEHDSGNRLFGTVTLAQENQGSKHGLILLVQDPKPNFNLAPLPKQEPVGVLHIERLDKWLDASLQERKQREWVGLNEKERNDIEDDFYANISIHVFDAIEAKLKEKNT